MNIILFVRICKTLYTICTVHLYVYIYTVFKYIFHIFFLTTNIIIIYFVYTLFSYTLKYNIILYCNFIQVYLIFYIPTIYYTRIVSYIHYILYIYSVLFPKQRISTRCGQKVVLRLFRVPTASFVRGPTRA